MLEEESTPSSVRPSERPGPSRRMVLLIVVIVIIETALAVVIAYRLLRPRG